MIEDSTRHNIESSSKGYCTGRMSSLEDPICVRGICNGVVAPEDTKMS